MYAKLLFKAVATLYIKYLNTLTALNNNLYNYYLEP